MEKDYMITVEIDQTVLSNKRSLLTEPKYMSDEIASRRPIRTWLERRPTSTNSGCLNVWFCWDLKKKTYLTFEDQDGSRFTDFVCLKKNQPPTSGHDHF